MNLAGQLAEEIRAYCAAHADAAKAAKWQRYFTEGYAAWGLLDKDDPLWHERQEHWLTAYSGLGVAGFLELGEHLFSSGKYEEGALATRFLARHRSELGTASVAALGKWFAAGIRNWAHTDVLCGEVIAPLLRDGTWPLELLAGWRASPRKFQRRAVPVAMLGLLKKPVDPKPLLEFLRPLMLDSERVVQQGLGWFLRETWKLYRGPAEQFLMEWKDQAPRLIFQYATERMTPAERQRFRRQKETAGATPAARAGRKASAAAPRRTRRTAHRPR
jgi:3-methyladenine DNA glycosylase AlkD